MEGLSYSRRRAGLSQTLWVFPKGQGYPSYLRRQAGFRQTSVGDPKRSGMNGGVNPTRAGELALAKPFG